MEFYSDDLAFIHHAGHTRFVRHALPGILSTVKANGVENGHVLDLGCGSGILARELTDRGYRVTGIDLSDSMVELSRREAPDATFIQGSFFIVQLPKCDAVTAIGECFNYIEDKPEHDELLPQLFERIHSVLRNGGILLFDCALPGRVPEGGSCVANQDDDWAVISRASINAESATLTRTITTYRRAGEMFRRTDEVHQLRLMSADAILKMLRESGFNATKLDSYGSLQFPEGYGAFLAIKSR